MVRVIIESGKIFMTINTLKIAVYGGRVVFGRYEDRYLRTFEIYPGEFLILMTGKAGFNVILCHCWRKRDRKKSTQKNEQHPDFHGSQPQTVIRNCSH